MADPFLTAVEELIQAKRTALKQERRNWGNVPIIITNLTAVGPNGKKPPT